MKKKILIKIVICVFLVFVASMSIIAMMGSKASELETKDLNLTVEHEVSILSQNLRRYIDKDKGENSVFKRFTRIKKEINTYDADIKCFQEYDIAWKCYLPTILGRSEYYRIGKTNNNGVACPIFIKKSKFDVLASGIYTLSDRSSPDNDENRLASWAKVKDKKTNKTLVICNGHFAFDTAIQVQSCRKLMKQKFLYSADAYVICGDFNYCKRDNIEAYNEMLANNTKDLAVAAKKEGFQGITGGTLHGYGTKKQVDRIDFFFGAPNLTTNMYTVINDMIDGQYVSDHYGILTYITINK